MTMLAKKNKTITNLDYECAFDTERAMGYVVMDQYERRLGYALDRERLEAAARVLACPVKVNPPNWQHGRLIYATARDYIARHVKVNKLQPGDGSHGPVTFLDIGTAKGFSALCARWAADDSKVIVEVVSLDVIDPAARVRRNTVVEVSGLKTLAETLKPWPETRRIQFLRQSSLTWLEQRLAAGGRVDFAFIDGKHSPSIVAQECAALRQLQEQGDVIVLDDLQVPGIEDAARRQLGSRYKIEVLRVLPHRAYAVARKL